MLIFDIEIQYRMMRSILSTEKEGSPRANLTMELGKIKSDPSPWGEGWESNS
jgi:hypothetical protein